MMKTKISKRYFEKIKSFIMNSGVSVLNYIDVLSSHFDKNIVFFLLLYQDLGVYLIFIMMINTKVLTLLRKLNSVL